MGSYLDEQHFGIRCPFNRPAALCKGEFLTPIEDSRRQRPVTRVLIVDDHAFIRRGVQTILHPFPEWELCGEADNGNDAIRMAHELKPEIIIMDISMPGLNGIEATRAIRKTQPGMKIVLLTLHESADLVRNAFRAGARGYLLKTDAEQELVRALTVVIGEGAYISPRIESEVVKSVISEMSAPH
jgi:DNA-binding NarL/FixJ family response regulator